MTEKEGMISAIQKIASELGKTPTRNEFFQLSIYSKGAIIRNFEGRYYDLCIAAGLTPNVGSKLAPGNVYKGVHRSEHVKIVAPELPADDIPVEKIIDIMKERFVHRQENHEAKKWMCFNVLANEPIGLNTFGDPHVDDDGCNWPQLLRDIEICRTTPGMFGMNIGDTHNNWVGRLMKEWSNQSTSRSDAFKIIDWFFKDAGINWLIMLLGNHDEWNFGSETMKQICKNVCHMQDWRAQFKLKFPNGREVLIDAAHDHAGHSQWNNLHAQQKASVMGGIAHLYIAGHRHQWALAQHECPNTNRIYWLARARGYKQIDSYGEKLGYGVQKHGASITTIINPQAKDERSLLKCFSDLEEGAEYLTWLRKR